MCVCRKREREESLPRSVGWPVKVEREEKGHKEGDGQRKEELKKRDVDRTNLQIHEDM